MVGRRIFKIEHEVIILSIAYGILFWIVDALLEYLFLSQEPFWELFLFSLPLSKICMRSGVIAGFTLFGVFISRSIAQRRKAEEEAAYMATHDSLTNLPNRILFNDRLDMALAQAHRNHKKVAVVMLDLDHFKEVNDGLGHKAGDKLLKHVASRLMELLRDTDTVARMGGDEFLLILPGITWVEDSMVICNRIRQTFQRPFFLDCIEMKVTASMGVAIYPHDGRTAGALIKNADRAMYWAKNNHRGSLQRYSSSMDDNPVTSSNPDASISSRNGEFRYTLQMLKKSVTDIIQTIARIVHVRDPYTGDHQRRVTALASVIAEEMDLPEEQINGLRFAATIHDIGKITVPAEILSKPGRLTRVEYEMIRDHPRLAYDILREIDFPWPVAEIVLQHHERLDGSGYPQGLEKDDILLEARILAVSDVIEAMSSHRPYRSALGLEKALEEIKENKARLYDENVVDACLRLFKEKKVTLNQVFKRKTQSSEET